MEPNERELVGRQCPFLGVLPVRTRATALLAWECGLSMRAEQLEQRYEDAEFPAHTQDKTPGFVTRPAPVSVPLM
ncbi:hypothetical protein Krac_0372 [Ktedonobacter racemifer DSM 44963]|uniref:Uncharacterized protein n=1 Tax=Ktedonobacter racemifer DSM 44963 TaxID=485913 RepID=D6U7J5_KTERA|nr:hypothetical protein Krac_0372 [Ktedonobacter racemifer DSM 44963]